MIRCFLVLVLMTAGVAGAAPNFLVILADDLGFSDLGCYGGEIETPNLDGLAKEGVRYTQFYNTARCWPSRAALMTGFYAQQVRRDAVPGVKSGGRGERPEWARLVPEQLRALGYRSYHSGKWHLDGKPLGNGFDRSYLLKDQGRFFNPRVHWKDDVKLPPVEKGTDFYGTIAVADHAVECLKEHAGSHGGKPFFQYVAFAAPHFPLHALPADIAKYRDRYGKGWEAVRAERWARQEAMGLLKGAALSKVERDLGPPYAFPKAMETLGAGEVNRPLEWDGLTKAQRAFQAEKMAIHAAMVDRMDREIGRILEQLKAMGAFDDTVVVFLSDNGASAEIMVRDDGHDPEAAPGSAATYLCLGPGWSSAANTPFRRHKTWVHEGGCATPMIVHWPKGIPAAARGGFRRQPGHVVDWVPTVMELVGGVGRLEVGPVERPGMSLVASFGGDAVVERAPLWWMHDGHRALRAGRWKLVAAKGDAWALHDLSADRSETRDLAGEMPERVKSMAATWERLWKEHQKAAGAE